MGRRIATFLVATLALWFSAWAMAQQNTTSSPSQDHPNAVPARTAEITIRGCVSGAKRYTFMQASTGAIFALTGKTDRFASVRGKLIEVTANEFAPPQNKSNGLPKLSVNKMRVVGDKCPVQAHPEPPSKPNSAWTNPPPPATSPATRPYADPGTVSQKPPNVNNPNISGDTGAPSPGTGNPPSPPQ
jgi:hypothetical protein